MRRDAGRPCAAAAVAAAAILGGCRPAPRTFRAADIRVYGVAVPAPVVLESLATTTMSAFFSIANDGRIADTLLLVESPLAARVSIHATAPPRAGAMMMPVVGLPVAAGGAVHLQPGGWHVMMEGLRRAPAPGDSVPMELLFARAGRLPIVARVVSGDDLDRALVH